MTLLTPSGTTTDVPKAQIKARRKTKASIMPDSLADSIDRGRTAEPGGVLWSRRRRR